MKNIKFRGYYGTIVTVSEDNWHSIEDIVQNQREHWNHKVEEVIVKVPENLYLCETGHVSAIYLNITDGHEVWFNYDKPNNNQFNISNLLEETDTIIIGEEV